MKNIPTRDREAWDAVGGVLVLVILGLLGYVLYRTAVTFVAVPVLWPLATSAGVLVLGWRELDWRARRRREAREQLEQKRQAAAQHVRDEQAVTLILHRGPHDTDMDVRRIGDAERDVVVSVLHGHFAAGRLDPAELEERLTRALASKTLGDLRRLVMDLPNGEVER
ncbi:DUF1707 SHOCT-like domain-containing protein [Actinomadura nitritigenes]|uniref:DUF1707 SHOCT-like domain-containing protein n=1 Tax=Actinomadura nitritigenes TaxID=134602 RepID=UPI003D8F0550